MNQRLTQEVSKGTRRISRARSKTRRPGHDCTSAVDPVAVHEAVTLLEGAVVALAAARFTDSDVAEMRELNRRTAAAIEALEYDLVLALVQQFHSVFHRRCPNEHLLELLRSESDTLAAHRRVEIGCSPESTVDGHDRLLDLIESGAGTWAIERHVQSHCGDGRWCTLRRPRALS